MKCDFLHRGKIFDAQGDARASKMLYSTPMTSVEEKMKRSFLHQEKYFFQRNRSGLFFLPNRSHCTDDFTKTVGKRSLYFYRL